MITEKLFDQFGRCSPELTSEEVIKKSRKYFYIDEAVRKKLNDSEIFKNLKNYYNDQINIDYDEFIKRISKLRNKVVQDSSINNIRNSINIPFILPIIKDHTDIGKDIDTLLEDNEISVRTPGKNVFLNASKVTATDIETGNGTVHLINRVLVPWSEILPDVRDALRHN